MSKLTEIQNELKAPKNQLNGFGKYKYRSCEDILEAVKPLLKRHDCGLFLFDEIENIGDKNYIVSYAIFKDGEEKTIGKAYAREAEVKKGMDDAQITGACSSYARKYALNGLFLIDDTNDQDTMDNSKNDITDINKDDLIENAIYFYKKIKNPPEKLQTWISTLDLLDHDQIRLGIGGMKKLI